MLNVAFENLFHIQLNFIEMMLKAEASNIMLNPKSN